MFVERNLDNIASGVLPVRPAAQVTSQAHADGLVVEEELVRLILELNPQVHHEVRQVMHGRQTLTSAKVCESAALTRVVAPSITALQVSSPQGFDPMNADYGDEENVKRLIQMLPSPPPPVNPLHRERLLRFFERYAVYRLPTVASLLRRYAGHETALFASLVEEYGPEPTLSDQDYFHELTPALPDGWVRIEAYRGEIYYKNMETRKVSWSRPRRTATTSS